MITSYCLQQLIAISKNTSKQLSFELFLTWVPQQWRKRGSTHSSELYILSSIYKEWTVKIYGVKQRIYSQYTELVVSSTNVCNFERIINYIWNRKCKNRQKESLNKMYSIELISKEKYIHRLKLNINNKI